MFSTEKSEKFTYWKSPWQKLLIFIAGFLSLMDISLNIQEYQTYQQLGESDMAEKVFGSYYEWERVLAQQKLTCISDGIFMALLFGILLIGIFARSERTARISEGVLFIILALVLLGLVSEVWALLPVGIKIIWNIPFILLFGGSIYTFWKLRKSE